MAMEKIFGRHRAEVKTLAGVYGAAYEGDDAFAAIQKDVEAFAEEEGRRPRMLVVKMGQDGHDRGAKVIATAFADIGFDVDVGPLFQTPEEAAQDAIDNDVHVIGISSQAAGHKTLAPKLVEALNAAGAGEILVICGGVIPQQDYQFLYDRGVKVTISTDDPPFFHTTMAREYDRLAEAFDWDDDVFRKIARTSLDAAFCDDDTRSRIQKRLEPENA